MPVELGLGRPESENAGNMLKGVVERMLRRERRTYVGNLYLKDGNHWALREPAPILPPNPNPNIDYGDHVLRSGDYLTIFDLKYPDDREHALWKGQLKFRSDGGFMYPIGVSEEYFIELFDKGYPAELRTSVKPGSVTAGETARPDNTVFGRIRARKPLLGA